MENKDKELLEYAYGQFYKQQTEEDKKVLDAYIKLKISGVNLNDS